jgi:predicted O-methyltransferase YrrM
VTSYQIADYLTGSTEPWAAELVAALAKGLMARNILELGAYEGKTTKLLSEVAVANGGQVAAVESDPARAAALQALGLPAVQVVCDDAISVLKRDVPPWDFAFVDDDHTYAHVAEELELLIPQMRRGGLIVMHDVIGVFGLDRLVHRHGGTILHTPLMHAAGGLGLISVHDPMLHDRLGNFVVIQ